MNIGILTKRSGGLTHQISKLLESSGNKITLYSEDELFLNTELLENDAYILKSKGIPYIYAGYYLQTHHIPVFPDPDISYKHKNRVESHLLLNQAGLLAPEFYLGSYKNIIERLPLSLYPLIYKPIMSSGSRDIKVIKTPKDLDANNHDLIYLEKFIEGDHFYACFIGEEPCLFEKPPLTKEREKIIQVPMLDEIKDTINKWRSFFNGNLIFGHLDIVRDSSSSKLYVVDIGTFPEYKYWKCSADPIPKICKIILRQFKQQIKNYK